jgi:hypothetical protein
MTVNASDPPRVAVAAIFKNEGPYVLEWVAHHRALGVETFFIADNVSTDETTGLLAALAEAGIVRHLPFPTPMGRPPQQSAYERIVAQHGAEADWIAFLDADEFLVPAEPNRPLAAILAGLDPGPDVGTVVVNWALYGSSGQMKPSPLPVVERFQRRAETAHPVNRHYKSILRPAAYAGPVGNPHHFPLKRGFRAVHVDGTEVRDVPGKPKGLSQHVVWSPLRINHYVIKSWEEFYFRKRARGRATRSDQLRTEAFFRSPALNDVLAPMPPGLAAAAEAERQRLEALLSGGDLPVKKPDPLPARGWKNSVDQMLRGFRVAAPQGAIEKVELGPRRVAIRGWAERGGSGRANSFAVRIGGRAARVESVERVARGGPAAVPAGEETGFRIVAASAAPIPTDAPELPIVVTALFDGGRALDLSLPANAPVLVVAGEAGAKPDAAAKPKPKPKPAPAVPDRPSMEPEGVELLTEALSGAGCYLEYGSGGSTVLASDLGVPMIVSVESDRAWLGLVRGKLAGRTDLARHLLLHADIGPTKALGHPVSDEHWRNFRTYPLAAWDLCRGRGLVPDLVLVDGRFRAACFLASLLFARPGCRILFDDYLERKHYHLVESLAKPDRQVGRMAVFTVPAAVDRDQAWQALLQAVTDPR